MRDCLVNKLISTECIISQEEYKRLCGTGCIHEYLLYGDNCLEGITLLNMLSQSDNILSLLYVVYEPIDQPIYIFKHTDSHSLFAIKICGTFSRWSLPQGVGDIIDFIDLTDYVFYSIENKRVVLAGENTETASVGNSQWQREGRKLGAARFGIPFIYQTFYSGRDESRDAIREPNSLQVYNQILYTVRYKTPSFVAYFENNFEGAETRDRGCEDSTQLLCDYIKATIVCDALNNDVAKSMQQTLEKMFLLHMCSYLSECKFGRNGLGKQPRLKVDFPVINSVVYSAIIDTPEQFAADIVDYLHGSISPKQFFSKYPFDNLSDDGFTKWSGYNNKQYIKDLLLYLKEKGCAAKSYISGQAKVGIASAERCKEYLTNIFPENSKEIGSIIDTDTFSEVVVMPLRIHKYNKKSPVFSADPESGEIAAFGELFGYNVRGSKSRPVIGYTIVDTPKDFDFSTKKGTKLYKAISHYVDILILNNSTVITNFEKSCFCSDFIPQTLLSTVPQSKSEECAVVSTFLNLTTISSDWVLNFIHTHHSSWQQMVVHRDSGEVMQHKIERNSSKIDLVLQTTSGLFMLAEGKNNYFDIIRDPKIQGAMRAMSVLVCDMYGKPCTMFDTFIYNLATVADKDPDYYAQREVEMVEGAIGLGHFSNIANSENFVVIIVYDRGDKTCFKLVYSPDFDTKIRQQLNREFGQ